LKEDYQVDTPFIKDTDIHKRYKAFYFGDSPKYFDDESYAHDNLEEFDMSLRKKQYSLNSAGKNAGIFPFVSELYAYPNQDATSTYDHIQLRDLFFVNKEVDFRVVLEDENYELARTQMNDEILKSLTSSNLLGQLLGARLTQGCAHERVYLFREDLNDTFVKPFLKRYS
jgi:hypothetical protein